MTVAVAAAVIATAVAAMKVTTVGRKIAEKGGGGSF
jgi:hypothetical protein